MGEIEHLLSAGSLDQRRLIPWERASVWRVQGVTDRKPENFFFRQMLTHLAPELTRFLKSYCANQIERQRGSCQCGNDIGSELIFEPCDFVPDSHQDLPKCSVERTFLTL